MSDIDPIEILPVEDNPGDARLTEEALKEANVHNKLHYVEDGVDAMEVLHPQAENFHVPPPDLILLDSNLPRKDGREVLAEAKVDPKLRHIPTVAKIRLRFWAQ